MQTGPWNSAFVRPAQHSCAQQLVPMKQLGFDMVGWRGVQGSSAKTLRKLGSDDRALGWYVNHPSWFHSNNTVHRELETRPRSSAQMPCCWKCQGYEASVTFRGIRNRHLLTLALTGRFKTKMSPGPPMNEPRKCLSRCHAKQFSLRVQVTLLSFADELI